jgi:hypothetical protein
MAIHNAEQKQMQGGYSKGIEASSMEMIMRNLQQYQYQKPIPSTVRELASNGIDSVAERNMARQILIGEAQVSDFFVEKEGAEFQDSKFDPNYYDLNWLSDDNNVYINYIVNGPLERDTVIFSDNGVGLGSYRLEKYMSLGYSTKRLSKLPLGKFGIGGKAGLSITGVDYFTMESRYNGMLFRFNIYSSSVDSIIPERSVDTGEENPHILFNDGKDGYKVYYQHTEEKNGVRIILTAKKNHQQEYINAVKSQLLYFENVRFNIIEQDMIRQIPFQAHILYEDDHIILSDNQYWSKPHLLLNKVNYGYINFDELELESKNGNIGIKIAPEDVDVNPSRESIIWNDRTKQTVLDRFNQVVDIASKMIQSTLLDTDYVRWMRACMGVQGRYYAEGTLVGRLAKIVDLSQVKPSFVPEPKLKYDSDKLLGGLMIRKVWIDRSTEGGKWVEKVKYSEITKATEVISRPIFLLELGEHMNNKKNKFLLRREQGSSVVPGMMYSITVVAPPMDTKEEMLLAGMTEEQAEHLLNWRNKNGNEGVIMRRLNWEYLMKSNEVTWYKDVVVPSDFSGDDSATAAEQEDTPEPEEEEEKVEERVVKKVSKRLSARELRKMNGTTLVNTPMAINSRGGADVAHAAGAYQMRQFEVPIADIGTWEAEEVYYTLTKEQDPMLLFAAMLTRDPVAVNHIGSPARTTGHFVSNSGQVSYGYYGWSEKKWFRLNSEKITKAKVPLHDAYNMQHFWDNREIMLLRPAPESRKYMENYRTMDKFFRRIETTPTGKKLTMSNVLIKWNTSRILKDKLHAMAFLYNWETFNPVYNAYYLRLVDYVTANYREMERYIQDNFYGLTRETYRDLISHLDKVKEFQEFVMTKPTEKEIAEMAQFMFNNKAINDAQAVDIEIMEILAKVSEYCNAIGVMFNYMPILTGFQQMSTLNIYSKEEYNNRIKKSIPMDLEVQIKQYLEANNLLEYGKEELIQQESAEVASNILDVTQYELPSQEEEKKDGAKLFIEDGAQEPFSNQVF